MQCATCSLQIADIWEFRITVRIFNSWQKTWKVYRFIIEGHEGFKGQGPSQGWFVVSNGNEVCRSVLEGVCDQETWCRGWTWQGFHHTIPQLESEGFNLRMRYCTTVQCTGTFVGCSAICPCTFKSTKKLNLRTAQPSIAKIHHPPGLLVTGF